MFFRRSGNVLPLEWPCFVEKVPGCCRQVAIARLTQSYSRSPMLFRALCLALLVPLLGVAQPVPVAVRRTATGYELTRGGRPYFVKGAGGHGYLDRLAAYGGNSIRTWSTDDAGRILDEAQRHGLTVMLGLDTWPASATASPTPTRRPWPRSSPGSAPR